MNNFDKTKLSSDNNSPSNLLLSSKEKCGEIIVFRQTKILSINCNYCSEEFKDFYQFTVHIFNWHLINETAECKKFNNNVIVDQNNKIESTKFLNKLRQNDTNSAEFEHGCSSNSFMVDHDDYTEEVNNDVDDNRDENEDEFDLSMNEILIAAAGDGREIIKKFDNKIKKNKLKLAAAATKSFICNYCGRKMSSSSGLKDHINLHLGVKPFECKLCPKKFACKKNLIIHERIHEGNPNFKCEYCDKKFYKSGDRMRHERIHTGEKPSICDICGKKFTTTSDMNKHRQIHSTEANFVCDLCNKKFYTKDNLRRHKLIHNKEARNRYKCGSCEKGFLRKEELTNHERIHTGSRDFLCKICGKLFAQSSGLYCHLKSHGIVKKPEKNYPCSKCNETFNSKNTLNFHQDLAHPDGSRPFKCELCNRCLTTKRNLTKHMVVHSTAKPYVCSICSAEFARPEGLKRHSDLHSDFKKYECDKCGKRFIQRDGLRAHKRTHKKDVETEQHNLNESI